ncbi:hypothetical protein BWD14_17940 [Leptospira santarosai]|uniref:Uncharacterized protein n=1 Tax=Leptospira santarosai TaxID=28183 RepID=A0AB73MPA1_9LEPT|nr:hypothetical protein BWD14_17940 [Leptospira santarosai]
MFQNLRGKINYYHSITLSLSQNPKRKCGSSYISRVKVQMKVGTSFKTWKRWSSYKLRLFRLFLP